MSYDVGEIYPATFLVVDGEGAPANPSAVTLTITKPDQSVVVPAPAIQNPPEVNGTFTYDYVLASEGLYSFAWAATGPVAAKTEFVHARKYRSALSLAEARDFLNQTDTRRDELIRSMMMAALEEAEKIVGTIVPRVITDEWVNGEYKDVIQFQRGPILSKTAEITLRSVYPGGPSWSKDDTHDDLIPNIEAATIRPANMLGFWWGPWEASYTAGRSVIDESIRLGILEILWDLWIIERGTTSDQAGPDVEQSEQFEYQLPSGYHPPPRAMALLEAYERPGFG